MVPLGIKLVAVTLFVLIIHLSSALKDELEGQNIKGICERSNLVYGENHILDNLLACSAGRAFDLDLTPHGEYIKSTSKTLVDQGLSNKTSVIYAKLSGLWTAKRSDNYDTTWRCSPNKTQINSIVELKGLSLEMVEKFDVQMHKNHHKLAIHKPCKTFDLPLWLCRQSKPIYRTTRTWVNRAFFNLTLSQATSTHKPTIDHFSYLFSCPETFRQQITHSPSAMYVMSKFIQSGVDVGTNSHQKRQALTENKIPLVHPASYSTTQDGKSPATPPYHTSVNLIVSLVSEELSTFMNGCILSNDCDLNVLKDSSSFRSNRFEREQEVNKLSVRDGAVGSEPSLVGECLDEDWLRQRVERAEKNPENKQDDLDHSNQSTHIRRSGFTKLEYPKDPNQLLDPYGHYHQDSSGRSFMDEK